MAGKPSPNYEDIIARPNSGAAKALIVLHWAAPIAIFASFIISGFVAACLLHRRSRDPTTAQRRSLTTILLLLVVFTLVAQACTFFVQSLAQRGFWAKQDSVVYILASLFAYGWMVLALHGHRGVLWWPYGTAFTLAMLLEIPITALQISLSPAHDNFAFYRGALQASRTLFVAILCLSEGWYTLQLRSAKFKTELDGEHEPLLANSANGSAHKPKSDSASTHSKDSDAGSAADLDSYDSEPEEADKVKKQQRERLDAAGNWWNYAKEYKIFIPMLWPSGNRFVQLCLGLIGLVLVAQRFLNILVPRQLGIIVNELTKDNGHGHLPLQAFGLWALYSYLNSRAGVYVISTCAELYIDQFTYKAIGAAAFRHIMTLSMDFHNEKNTGELIRAVDQGHSLQRLLDFALFEVAPIFIDLVISLVFVTQLFDIYMAFILGVVGVAYIWVGTKTAAWSIKRRRRYNKAWRDEAKVQNEAISNWTTVSHFNRGRYECEKYEKTIDEHTSAEIGYYLAYHLGGGAQSLIMLLGRTAAIFLAIYRVSQGAVPVGSLVTLSAYWASIEAPLTSFSWSIRALAQMLTDSERLLQLFQTKATVTDAPNAPALSIKHGEVEFTNVHFAYDPRKPTLKNISFVAKPGQTIALCGETGGGKSTILKLLYRYYDVNAGSIRIDGQDIREVTLDSLRDAFGMCPQDPTLFNVSIMENLRYARLDATDDEIKAACADAAIHDKITSFPDGYSATVGERGVKLSGGEMQRVAIARAILRQPKIVLLDEATSMIDVETEATIQTAFQRLSRSRTTFVIAHRLSTIQHADLILVVQDGEIIESGSHEVLMRDRGGKYRALWSRQLNKEVQAVGRTLEEGEGDDGNA
ncbi:putative ABC transporter [Neohortaea acidophila]|uniref:Putative ABC transporter n=1 Tax=Neohortaea acidophila TaxID=245834 RepID=A0A6A6Q5E8_9PEZI|nr:putative ABC transporter [Neohortaea acidophila]KAF2487678.1 putative ABC transporter [Neohortaea acidophila]